MKLRGALVPQTAKRKLARAVGSAQPGNTGRKSRFIALVARVAVMNSPLTVVDPAAPRRRNPIAIGANRDELGYG